MQPLDTAVFGPLKKSWNEECHEFIHSHPGKVITKYQFSEIFSKAWLKSMVPANISGFKVCGIYPFNPKAVLDHDPCLLRRSLRNKAVHLVNHSALQIRLKVVAMKQNLLVLKKRLFLLDDMKRVTICMMPGMNLGYE